MNKKILFFIVMLLFNNAIGAWDKSAYDIEIMDAGTMLHKATGASYQGREIRTTVSEVTLIQGGYFTIGTHNGLSASALDDHCSISFGHPYALTSYPLLSIDGNWGKPEAFINIYQAEPEARNDSLVLTYSKSGSFQYAFLLTTNNSGSIITLNSTLRNLDTQSHTFGLGLVFDSGLGKKGDGWVKLNSHIVQKDTLLTTQFMPSELMMTERNGGAEGLRLQLDSNTDLPDKIIIANWKDIYQNDGDDFNFSQLRMLYDLALKFIWNEQMVAAGAQLSRTITFQLPEPDLNTPLFIRWDLTSFLSIENNLLFPRSFYSYAEIANTTSQPFNNCSLDLKLPNEFDNENTSFALSIPANDVAYQAIPMNSKEAFEDKIVDLSMTLKNNGAIVDRLQRFVFIPAVPLADTGLTCTIDTVITSNYPQINVRFDVQVEKTGQRLFNLQQENVFVYENQTRIVHYEMSKDTTGGVSMADIVFVLDCSGSMGDDIQAVRNNINEFADSLLARGIDFRLGVVTFSTTIDDVYDLTADVELFKSWLSNINLWGGRENSLAALYHATELSLRPNSKRTFVWITDEDYPVSPEINLTVQVVIDRLLAYEVTVHSIGETYLRTAWSDPIIEPTGGNFYDIHGNFRDILLDISRMKKMSKYMITYSSSGVHSGINNIALEIHYAGLGGFGYAEYVSPSAVRTSAYSIHCYPNPFNPTVKIHIVTDKALPGAVDIYNILGQRVQSFPLKSSATKHIVEWNARDLLDQPVAAGNYFIRLRMFGTDGRLVKTELIKILYMK